MKIKFSVTVLTIFQLAGCAGVPAESPPALQKLHEKGAVLINNLLGAYSPENNEPPKALQDLHDKGELLIKKSQGSNSSTNKK